MNIGYKIKELRLERNLTQEQLAGYLSVSTPCVCKWENNVTMPDIQMLPMISAFFGVTIDELFDLTDEAHISRIQAMVESKKIIEPDEFYKAEKYLLQKEREQVDDSKYPMILADLYMHMVDVYRYYAEMKAKRAIELRPGKKYNHSLLRMAQQGKQMDWNYENRSGRIEYYKNFVKDNPNIERGYVCLIDELIAANRYKEAWEAITTMDENIDTLRPIFYKGYLNWIQNDRLTAENHWKEMQIKYPDEWLGYALLGDCMASYCEYDSAIKYYETSLKLQEVPRYTDSQISIALIYEILGETDKAVGAWENVINILKNEHHITEGKTIDEVNEAINRLKKGK